VLDVWTDYVTLSFDGNGSGQIIEVGGVSEIISFTYSVNSDGKFTIGIGGSTGTGIVSSDGNQFTFIDKGQDDNTFDEVHYTGIKKSSGMSNTSLNGTYVMTTFGGGQDPNGNGSGSVLDVWTDYVTLSFDGNGNGQIIEVGGVSESFSFTYSVNSDGKFTIGIAGGNETGIVSSDGNYFTFISKGPDDNTFDEVHYTGIKKSSGMSNTSLNGTYVMTTFGGGQDPDGNGSGTVLDVWTDYVTLSFDGNGSGQITEVCGVSEIISFTYSVNSDGKFTIGIAGGNETGIVSSDGNHFTFTSKGPDDNTFDEVHYTGIKK
jgi:hypothetical protein